MTDRINVNAESSIVKLHRLRARLAVLLTTIGSHAVCGDCGTSISWVRTRRGKNMAVQYDGQIHFKVCGRGG